MTSLITSATRIKDCVTTALAITKATDFSIMNTDWQQQQRLQIAIFEAALTTLLKRHG